VRRKPGIKHRPAKKTMGRSKSRAVRKVALIKAHLRAADEWIEIAVGNVSASGLMAKCPVPPAPGTEVEIRRRGTVITGRVVWSTATRFGMASDQPIDVEELTGASGLQAQKADEGPSRKWLWHWRSRE
jgi:hypothetical protein